MRLVLPQSMLSLIDLWRKTTAAMVRQNIIVRRVIWLAAASFLLPPTSYQNIGSDDAGCFASDRRWRGVEFSV